MSLYFGAIIRSKLATLISENPQLTRSKLEDWLTTGTLAVHVTGSG
jgi:hypothetical protein